MVRVEPGGLGQPAKESRMDGYQKQNRKRDAARRQLDHKTG